MKKTTLFLSFALALTACSSTGTKEQQSVDTLNLYRSMTQGKSQFQVQTGEPAQLTGSDKICITAQCKQGDKDCKATDHYNGSPLMATSDYQKYYGLSQGTDGYSHYSNNSQFAKDVKALVSDMDQLMASFTQTGLRKALTEQGKTPALMFDIDNTLEFTAGLDDDAKGDGPAITEMVEFANRWCFKDGLACYFITARSCTVNQVTPTEKWLKTHLNLSDEQQRRYTHLSGNKKDLSCKLPGSPRVAYKDVIREAVEQQDNVFWLMSIGDQLTDSLGAHSGMKIRVPNQFFHSDSVPNQFAPYGVGQCGSPVTMAPPRECADSLKDKAIQYSSLEYCRTQPATK